MKKLQNSIPLKFISYILVPILALNILINVFSISYYDEYKEDIAGKITYFETERFADNFLRSINNSIWKNVKRNQNNDISIVDDSNNVISEEVATEKSTIELNSTTDLEKSNSQNLEDKNQEQIDYGYYNQNEMYEYLIIDENGKAYTNIQKTVNTDTVQELREYVKGKKYFWIYEGKEVNTNIGKMKFENIAYNTYLEQIEDSNCTVYACIANENNNEFYKYNLVYNLVSSTYESAPLNIAISTALLFILCIYIIISIGHKKEEDGIYTNSLDKIPLEIVEIICILLLVLEFVFLELIAKSVVNSNWISNSMIDTLINLCVLMGIAIYTTLAITGVTIIRRIKAKVFFKNTITYKIIEWIKKHTTDILFTNVNNTAKLALRIIIFFVIQLFLIVFSINTENILFPIIVVVIWYIVFKKLLEILNSSNKIKEKIKNIYNGNTQDLPLQENEFKGDLREVAIELNDISGGLSNAIQEAMKSERLKTELITNVSHDIKTPLTSIINYVDLMKQENIENEKVKEYLEILDNKSQRLKKLTEDLVEASKASSGNIKLNIEKLNVKELINQVRGEFEDKFEKRGLTIIENQPKEDIYIEADSRYMFRVMENMYVNISKYALENSRVYVDIEKEDNKVQIILKNISQDKLNISVDELMQRFVRGDSARTTEGSGLGISIASSLTKLQNGNFNIYLDGDLFKVVIEFKIA